MVILYFMKSFVQPGAFAAAAVNSKLTTKLQLDGADTV